ARRSIAARASPRRARAATSPAEEAVCATCSIGLPGTRPSVFECGQVGPRGQGFRDARALEQARMGGAAESGTGLLTGLRVLDLSIWRPGPYATQLLAEIGADVIKVEPPGGDPMRRYPELFASLNVNKRGIVLDLKRDSDRARALELAAEADVLVEGFRPGVAARLGMGYGHVGDVNPTVIYCSLSGLGQDGPLALV